MSYRLWSTRVLAAAFAAVIVLGAAGMAVPAPVQAQTSSGPTAFDMLAALNEWRLQEGLAPFRPNPTLTALASFQLQYLLLQDHLPDRLHDGVTAEGPRVRALWYPYQWPYYRIPSRVSLEEIIVAQHTVQQGINWWKNSDIHRRAVTNPNYREIGVAAMPYPNGTVFVVELGGRPNVLPAMIHPDRQTLYLTRDTYSGARAAGALTAITGVRLLDTDQTPLTDWQPWQRTLPVPQEVSGDTFYVEYTDGSQTVTTAVNLETDIFPLPGYLAGLTPPPYYVPSPAPAAPPAGSAASPHPGADIQVLERGPDMLALLANATGAGVTLSSFHILALKPEAPPYSFTLSGAFDGLHQAGMGTCYLYMVEGSALAPPEQCTGTLVIQRVNRVGAFWYNTGDDRPAPLLVFTDRGHLAADCRVPTAGCSFFVEAAPALTGAGDGAAPVAGQIRLIYDANSLSLLNAGEQPLNLYGLSLSDGSRTLSAQIWNTAASTAPLSQLPAADCLQVWRYGITSQPRPSGCRVRQSWVTVEDSETVWTAGQFSVFNNGRRLGICQTSAGECIIDLP